MKTPANSPSSILGSNAFGLAAWVAAAFVLAAIVIAAILMWRTSDLLVRQVVTSLEHEAAALHAEYRQFGFDRTRETVARKSQVPGPALYYLTTKSGGRLAGNFAAAPRELDARSKGGVITYTRAGASGDVARSGTGVVLRRTLGADAVLFVGRDIEDIENFSRWLRWFLILAFVALTIATIAAGYAVSRGFLKRLATVNTTVQSIMQGDLADRVPISGQHDELDTLSRNLNQMLDRINQLMLGMREVSDNIAHDLKTPLNRLRNHAEGALRDARGLPAHREGLERVIEEADGLIRTFNALLLIAKLESGSLEKTAVTFNVSEILEDVRELYEPVAEEQGLTICTKAPDAVNLHANKQLIVQAVANLIDNAIKYGSKTSSQGPDEALITAEVRATPAHVIIRVGDHGPGIPAKDRERVLNRFVRLQQSRTQPGTGLGLSLVAAVARMHGGKIELDDNAPGLQVTLTLPHRIQLALEPDPSSGG